MSGADASLSEPRDGAQTPAVTSPLASGGTHAAASTRVGVVPLGGDGSCDYCEEVVVGWSGPGPRSRESRLEQGLDALLHLPVCVEDGR